LRKEAPFSIQWDGDTLSVTQRPALDFTTSTPSSLPFTFQLVITTEGEFVNGTIGEISSDRKMLVVPNLAAVGKEIVLGFTIRGLAEVKQEPSLSYLIGTHPRYADIVVRGFGTNVPNPNSATSAGLNPHDADLVLLCIVARNGNSLEHVIAEVWRGQKLLPKDFQAAPIGKLLVTTDIKPGETALKSALVCYKTKPGSEDVLTDHEGRSIYYVDSGQITLAWHGAQADKVSIQKLKSEIKK
jgi:hypothetical protein